MRYVRLGIALLIIALAMFWLVAKFIQSLAGLAEMPKDIKTLSDAIKAALIWLAHAPAWAAYPFGAALLLIGLCILLWHPEEGWRWRPTQRRERELPPGAITFVGTPPQQTTLDAPDVTAAKLALGNYVIKDLIPIIESVRPALAQAAHYIRDSDRNTHQAQLAWDAVVTAQPQVSQDLSIFNSVDDIKSTSIPQLEMRVMNAVSQYSRAVSMISKVIRESSRIQATWTGTAFASELRNWLPQHRAFEAATRAVFSDVHFTSFRSPTRLVDQETDRWIDYFNGTA